MTVTLVFLVAMIALESRRTTSSLPVAAWHTAAVAGAAALWLSEYPEPAILFLAAYASVRILCGGEATTLASASTLGGATVVACAALLWIPARFLSPLAGTWLLFHASLRFLRSSPRRAPLAVDAACACVAIAPRGCFVMPDAALLALGALFALFSLSARPVDAPSPSRVRTSFAWIVAFRLLVLGLVRFEAASILLAAILAAGALELERRAVPA